MAGITRRHFLQGTAAVGAVALASACHDDTRAADPTPTTTPAVARGPLVVITLAGGNDALNTVVPVDDSAYRSARGALAIDAAVAHDVGEGFALHPALTRTKGLWDGDRLAIVHGVGFDGLDRSHFHCMDVWQAADSHDQSSGWLGRWLDLEGDDPLDVVAVGRGLPLLARGDRRAAAVVPPGPFRLAGDPSLSRLLSTMAGGEHEGLRAAVAGTTADLLAVVDTIGPLLDGTSEDDTFASRLGTVATMIDAGMPCRAYAVQHDGFDTHANQAATHQALLTELDAALGDLLTESRRDVTVVMHSEFGRRVVANGSGTDHGGAGTVLVAGNVRPGHHGEPPPLGALVDGDLRTTVDFRAVYACLLGDILGTDPADVIPDAPAPLALV